MQTVKILFNSLLLIFLFVSPHIVYSIIPNSFVFIFYTTILLFYFFLFFSFVFIDIEKYLIPFLFSCSFIALGTINSLVHNEFSFFNILAPLIAFLGYHFILEKRVSLKIFDYFILSLYLYFYIVYYSILPDLFFRPGFDEDEVVFDNASSNAIPIALNITLYSYLILNELYQNSSNKKILIFSIINFILIIIQQSRIGILVSFILVLFAFYNFSKRSFFNFLFFTLLFAASIFSYYHAEISEFFTIIGEINGLETLDSDIRGQAQKSFFSDMEFLNLFFGYKKNHLFAVGVDGDILYTYNVFLDLWNRYGLFQFIILIIFLVYRVLYSSKFYFPLLYLLPFFLYSLVESLFFPNFWDCIIYLLFFLTKKKFSQFYLTENRNDLVYEV